MCTSMFFLSVVVVFLTAVQHGVTLSYSFTSAHYTINGKLVERHFNSDDELVDCNVFGDRQFSEDVLKRIPREQQFMVGDVEFYKMVDDCSRLDSSREVHIRKKRAIFPDTKWCGAGNIAKDDNDLGTDAVLDRCCRTHDKCPIFILPRETKYGIRNSGPFTASHCSCDQKFRDCLLTANSSSADLVGQIFFSFVKVSCIRMEYPQKCSGWWLWKTCVPDKTKKKRLAFVDGFLDYPL